MKYQIVIKKKAFKFIEKQPKNIQSLILNAINKLPEGDTKPLKGYEDYYRLRVGIYRIVYTIDNGNYIIYIIDANTRGDVYKHL